MKPLPEEVLIAFTKEIFRIPCYSVAHEEARLTQDSRMVYFAKGYHSLRIFPILTEASAQLIKDAYREEVENMIRKDGLEVVKQLPISLEEMTNKTVREINPAPVWRLENVHETHQVIGGFQLRAMRYITDTVTRFPCISMTYERTDSQNIEVYLIGRTLDPVTDTTLRMIQMEQARQMAEESSESPQIELPKIIKA